jgi:hypothetical protein
MLAIVIQQIDAQKPTTEDGAFLVLNQTNLGM